MNAREDYIAKMNTPSPGSYGGGEDFGSPFGGDNSPPGTSNEGDVSYGGNPHVDNNTGSGATGGGGGSSISDNNTGSGATGGTGTTSGPGGLATLAGIDASKKFLGARQPGLDGLIQDNLETYGLTGKKNINDLTQLDSPNINTDNSSIINQLKQSAKNLENTYNDLRTFDVPGIGGQLQLDPDIGGGLENPGATWQKPLWGGNLGVNLGHNTSTDNTTGSITWGKSFADGGPVGIMSLPEGYAAGGPVGVDPSDWRVIQQIIAAGGNPEDYVNYANGGFVDPTADGGWIDRLSRWWYGDDDPENDYLDLPPENDYLPPDEMQGLPPSDSLKPYNPNNPNHFMIPEGMEDMDIKDILEQMKGERFEANNGGEVHNPYMGPQAQSRPPTPEEKKPFGGTRENILDHIEAFDNAPHHMEEPMVGMYGERVPLTLARRVQKYMEGLDPVKRDIIQETLNMFQMKKRMQEMEELNENSGFFGPIPNEYEA